MQQDPNQDADPEDPDRTASLPELGGVAVDPDVADDAVPLPAGDHLSGMVSALKAELAALRASAESEHGRRLALERELESARAEAPRPARRRRGAAPDAARLARAPAALREELEARDEVIAQLRGALAARHAQPAGGEVPRDQYAAELAALNRELLEARAQSAVYLEALRTHEWRRAEADSSVDGASAAVAHSGADLRQLEADVAQLRQALGASDARLEEQAAQILHLSEDLALARAGRGAASPRAPTASAPAAPAAPARDRWEFVRLDLGEKRSFELRSRTRLGRATGCELHIDSPSVSRYHALVVVDADGAVIEDLNSTNGVYVNGRKILRERLRNGDSVTMGEAKFRVSCLGPSAPPP